MIREPFFTLPDGRTAEIIKLRHAGGFGVDITNFGGCIVSLFTPDKNGELQDVVLGWKNPADYLTNEPYFGAIIGRVPNRITDGRFTLDGRIYQMVLNNNNCCTLHGGFSYAHRLWNIESASGKELILTLFSPNGDAGFPGNLLVRAAYRLLEDHTLEMEISAESDALTVADFTNHAYFNLNGEKSGSTADHTIKIAADKVTATDEFLRITGAKDIVPGSYYDLRQGKKFSEIFAENASGFDDNFILGDKDHVYRENAAVVHSENSGITMRIHTSRPGVQFYMGSFLDTRGKSTYTPGSGFCLETQNWPDSMNHPEFPQITVAPGRPHHSVTRYCFS